MENLDKLIGNMTTWGGWDTVLTLVSVGVGLYALFFATVVFLLVFIFYKLFRSMEW